MAGAGEVGQQPVAGVYEKLITQDVRDELKQLESMGWKAIDAEVSAESTPHVLARHIGEVVARRLNQLPPTQQVRFANHILSSLETGGAEHGEPDLSGTVVEGPRQLLALAKQEAPGAYAIRPLTPLSETSLLTNSPEDLSLGAELRAELATADRIDLLCAFVKWYGIRFWRMPCVPPRSGAYRSASSRPPTWVPPTATRLTAWSATSAPPSRSTTRSDPPACTPRPGSSGATRASTPRT